jgi:hypothetical protein
MAEKFHQEFTLAWMSQHLHIEAQLVLQMKIKMMICSYSVLVI